MAGHLERHPEFGLVYCDYRWVDEQGKTIEVRSLPGPGDLLNVPSVGACFLYRRAVYEAVGDYDTTAFLAEDYDYWVRIGKRFPVAHLAGVAPYAFLCHEGALSATRRPELEIQAARIRAKHSESPAERRRSLSDGHFGAAYGFRKRGRFRESFRHGVLSVAYGPTRVKHYLNLIALGKDVLAASLKSSAARGRGAVTAAAPPAGR